MYSTPKLDSKDESDLCLHCTFGFFLSLITYEFPIPARLPRAWFVHSPWQHDRILGILWVKSWAFQFGLGDESEMDGKRDNH